MIKPLPLLLIALQALSLLAIVCVLLLAPNLNGLTFLYQIGHALLLLVCGAIALVWLKLTGRPGHSRLIGAASIVFVLSGPIALAGSCVLQLDPQELGKVGFCSFLVYIVGCLFYWVSLGEEADLVRPL
jgi:hypothetical protein